MQAEYYQFLKKFISFPSVSYDSKFFHKMEDISIWLKEVLGQSGIQTKIIQGYGHPIVLWHYQVSNNLPTCLLYGHYDVQSAEKSDGWKNDPFSLFIWKEKIYGRGVVDNKWQVSIHLQTVFSLIKEKKLWYNLIILLDGNKESWSMELVSFLEKYKDSLQADFSLISDWTIIGDYPCVDVWFRGGFNAKLSLETASMDLHSGLYGGIVPNVFHELNKLLAWLFDREHRVTVPYFYYNVEDIPFDKKLTNAEKEKAFDFDLFKKNVWISKLFKEKGLSFFDQIWLRPTIQITGVSGGYIWDWFKNIVPHQSITHLNFRLVANQNPEKIARAFEWWVRSSLPDYVRFSLETKDFFAPVKININNNMISKVKTILEDVYWCPLLYNYSGSWLPIVKSFSDILKLDNILVPLANDDCNIYGVNENFDISLIGKWFEFSRRFFEL